MHQNVSTKRRALLAAGALCAAVGVTVAGVANGGPKPRSAQDSGGLALRNYAMTGLVIDRTAVAGATDTREIGNNSKQTLSVTVKARPWTQSSSGAVSPNRRRELSQVELSEESFTLAPGESKPIEIKLRNSTPTYGALEVVGLPADANKRKGVVAGYRIVTALRYNPAERTHRLRTGTIKLAGPKSKRRVELTVRNSGNTVDPVSGNVTLRGTLGTRSAGVRTTRILPGKSVKLTLWSQPLPAGTYTARVTLTQGDHRKTVTRKLRVRG